MADEAGIDSGTGNAPVETAGQAPATPATPTGFTIPEGHRLVPESEYTTLNRSHQQWKGSEPLVQAAVKAGLKTTEDIQKFVDMKERGFDFDNFARSFQPKKPEAGDGESQQGMNREDLDKLLDQRDSRSSAMFEHKSASKDQERLMQSVIKELAGDDANEFDAADWKLRIRGHMADNPLFYDEDSPLSKEQYRPYGESEFNQLRDHFKSVAEKRAAAGTAGVAKAASEAAKRPAQTTAGDTGGQGKSKNDGNRPDRESFDKDRRQKASDLVEKRRQAEGRV